MKPITINTKIDADGVLRLELPFESEDAEQNVLVTVKPERLGRRQWSPEFFTEVAGQWEGELVRPDQGELKEPEEWT